jgi:hypothetical protein
MYHLTKSLDPTRLVISNEGWEHVKSDICSIHDYDSSGETLRERYGSQDCVKARPCNRPVYVPGYAYGGEPVQVSEFGGIRYSPDSAGGWGYSEAHSEEQFLKRYMDLTHALLRAPALQGYCYTQLTDVQQEKNGLLTEKRQPKAPVASILSINQGLMP